MENNNQKQLLNQLEVLAEKAASQQAEIAGQEAEHAFRTLLQHKIEIEMKKQAEKTYNKLLVETQDLVNQFAQKASQRVLDIESSTISEAPVFETSEPEFADFSKALSAERTSRNKMAKLITGNSAEESEILAAHSMGMSPEEIAVEILDDDDDDTIAQVKKIISNDSEEDK